MQCISVQLKQINAAVTNNYNVHLLQNIWWQSQTLEWVHPHKHQHGTILYTYYTVSSYFQLAQAYDMNSTHVSWMEVILWQLFFFFFGWLEIQTDIVPPNSASNAFAFVAVQNGVPQAAPHLPVQQQKRWQRCHSLWSRTASECPCTLRWWQV